MGEQQASTVDSALALHRWRAEEHRIRDDYLAAVEEARRQYDMDTAPARAAYDHAERAAWTIYMTAGRANWTAYTEAIDSTAHYHPHYPLGNNPDMRPAGDQDGEHPRPALTLAPDPEGDQP